ncbi:hypothetical protein F4810DRAFT_690942 [Camillea tinctor]|nr:hypothetical protein F4810DRAFT_690942 [Camillea tinctor]
MAKLSSNEWLCFTEAVNARSKHDIDDDEYYHHLLRHLTGETHEYDREYATKDNYRLRKWDSFAYSIQCLAKEMESVKDTTPFERVFLAYRTGTLENIINHHGISKEKDAKPCRRLLAMRALLDKRVDVLQFCPRRGGFKNDDKLEEEACSAMRDGNPELSDVLGEAGFRKLEREEPWVAFDVSSFHPVD